MTETSTVELPKYRDKVKQISPPWLAVELGERILYALAAQADAFADALVAGVKQRFPGLYSFDSLPWLGRERRLARGIYETDSGYAARLRRWLTDHQLRGGPYALLTQLYLHYAPNNFPIDLVYYNGIRYRMAVDGTITRDSVPWRADTNTAKWARWYLFYFTDQWVAAPPTPDELADLKLIPREWNAAHPNGTIILWPPTGAVINFHPGCATVNSATGEPINTDSHTITIPVDSP